MVVPCHGAKAESLMERNHPHAAGRGGLEASPATAPNPGKASARQAIM